jgi:hypothetical protein
VVKTSMPTFQCERLILRHFRVYALSNPLPNA